MADLHSRLLDAVEQTVSSEPDWRVVKRDSSRVLAMPVRLREALPAIGIAPDSRAWFSLHFEIQSGGSGLGMFWRATPVRDVSKRNQIVQSLLEHGAFTGIIHKGNGVWTRQESAAFSGQRISSEWWRPPGDPDLAKAGASVSGWLANWDARLDDMINAIGINQPLRTISGSRFTVGALYSREDIQRLLGLEPVRGGNWFTGYTQHAGEWYLFPNVGTAGRTGHNYGNRWEGIRLRWFGKTNSKLHQPSIKAMIAEDAVVHLFTREGDRDPFTYQGLATALETRDVSPVEVVWECGPSEISLPGELEPGAIFREGATKTVTVDVYERNRAARAACLAHHGYRCAACDVLLAEIYGPVAEEFVHVHHLKSLAEIGAEYQVDPVHDLFPVCPNCHAIIHLRKLAYSLDEVKAFIRSARTTRQT